MAADIEISADTSDAVSAVGALGRALDDLAKKNLSGKAVTSFTNQVERDLGKLAAKMVNVNGLIEQQQSKFSQFAQGKIGGTGNRFGAALTQGMQAARRETDTYNRSLTSTLNLQERIVAANRGEYAAGIKQNSAGQNISATTGRFVSAADVMNADALTSQYERLLALRKQDQSIGAQSRAGMMLEQNLASKFVDREAELYRIRQRSTQQRMLEQVFAKQFYGLADPAATRMQRLANVMRQIPPATWGQSLGRAGSAISNMSNSTRYALYDVSASAGIAGAAILGLGIAATTAAISHERAFANVQRTTQTSAQGYVILNRQLEEMAMSLPVTYEELTNIATAAGQLGISASGVASFTRTVAMLTATTNLTADAAGVALARFRTFFAVTEGENSALAVTDATMSNLASSILKVGVNSIATETGIVNVATQIASMADYAGFTANQVVGLAGALSSIGVAPELSRGTITRTFSLIGDAVSTGGIQLEKFASLAGTSSEQFRKAWGTEEFAGVFTNMMKGLYGVSQAGGDANLTLMELGFNSVRDRPLLLRLASAADEAGQAGGLLSQTMADAYDGWVKNAELAIQYSKISNTTSARIQVLAQSFEQLFATMGKQTGGFVGEAASGLTDFVRGLESLSRTDGGQVFGSIAVQAAALVGGFLLLVSVGARVVASIQGVGVAFTAMTTVAETSMTRIAAAFRIASLAGGIIGLIGALVGIGVGFAAMQDGANKAKRAIQDVDGLAAAMSDSSSGFADSMVRLDTSTKDYGGTTQKATSESKKMVEALYGTRDAARAGSDAMETLANTSKHVSLQYTNAADQMVNAALIQSEGFQQLFDLQANRGWLGLSGNFSALESAGFKPELLDWDAIKKESIREGGNVGDLVRKQISKQLKASGADLTPSQSNRQLFSDIGEYADEVNGVLPNIAPELKKARIEAELLAQSSDNALQGMANGTISVAEGMDQLGEATQKAVESYAKGLAGFADTGNLIKLTQQQGTLSAEDFGKAWQDAYGGASFKLSEYLGNFRNAAKEQQTFVQNLQQLSAAGMSTSILNDLASMGPEANRLVQALVDDIKATGGKGLAEFEDLWGQTGYDSMVRFAVQAQLGQEVVNQVMAMGGVDALKAFNAKLSSGVGVDQALKELQADINKGPQPTVTPKTNNPTNLTWAQKKVWEEQNRLNATARVRWVMTPAPNGASFTYGNRKVTPFATGGHVTGPGSGTSDSIPASLSNGEFVFTAKATRRIGVSNLYAMMNAAQGGRKAPRGNGGYANGGVVSGGGMPTSVVAYLSPEDRALIKSIQPLVSIGDRVIAQANKTADRTSSRRGV